MAYTDISPRIVTRERRVFRCTYYCDDCTRAGSEWTDHLLVAGPSWCPCCDRLTEPDSVDEITECGPEFDLGDGLDEALDDMDRANADLEAFNREAV